MFHVLVSLAVIGAALHLPQTGKGWKFFFKGVLVEFRHQKFRQASNAGLVVGVSDVDNPAVANISLVFDNSVQAFHPFGDVGKTSFLVP